MLELLSALHIAGPAAHTTGLTDSTTCDYFSCDHSADYISTGSNGETNLTGDGTIYPGYTPLSGAEGHAHTAALNSTTNSTTCNYYSCDNSNDYIGTNGGLLTDGTIYPDQSAAVHPTTGLTDSTTCDYFSCDHSAHYVGTGSNGENNLTGDGVIYPKYTPLSGAVHPTTGLTDSTTCDYYSCDHSADYIGTGSNGETNLTGDGVIYPAYAPFANGESHETAMLCAPAEPGHAGAYFCSDPAASCSTTVVDPTLKPIELPVFGAHAAPAAPGAPTMLSYEPADHSGAFYCTEPEANCSVEVVDPVLKPLPAIALAPPVPSASDSEAKAQRPTPGVFVLAAHACILGAAEATAELVSNPFKEGALDRWSENFGKNSQANADAVTPVGGLFVKQALAAK
eukprot:CAMPEP_0173391832 /NCGR_PEP_ID=MMETSP1356-20130122/18610_1 /TAXON_ID=77927 ORGANISM="Hemiselmis virescens, Strain PCC157" /NCGR_SAMPLE_ID=MMETSP1356 /ASSEMBLY_ACC=CAM_ASM_000847 /LENGTH=396 /DNA_ID=CAMNT_0014349525 /DNA_START=16 /DNA_END=1206 /DNA_ORIENTATION=+